MELLQQNILDYYFKQKRCLQILHQSLIDNNLIEDENLVERIKNSSSANELTKLVENHFDTSVKHKNRKQTTVFCRKAVAYILHKYTQLSLNEISRFIGVTDHSTVIYNIRTCKNLIETEDWYEKKIKDIEDEIKKLSIFVNKR